MTLSIALGSAGPGKAVSVGGKPCQIHRIEQGQKAAFSAWLEARMEPRIMARAEKFRKRARELRTEAQAMMTVEEDPKTPKDKSIEIGTRRLELQQEALALEVEAREMVKQFDAELASEQYEFDGEACRAVLGTRVGATKITWLLLRDRYPKITEQMIVDVYDNNLTESKRLHAVVQWALGFRVSVDEKNDPSPASTQTPAEIQDAAQQSITSNS